MTLVLISIFAFFVLIEPARLLLRAKHDARVGAGWNQLPVLFNTIRSERFCADTLLRRFCWSFSSAMKIVLPAFALASSSFVALVLFLLLMVTVTSYAVGSRQKWVRGSYAVVAIGFLFLAMVANTSDANVVSYDISTFFGYPMAWMNCLLLMVLGLPLFNVHPFEFATGRIEKLISNLSYFGWIQLVSYWFFSGIHPVLAFAVASLSYLLVSVLCSYLPKLDFETSANWLSKVLIPVSFLMWIVTLTWVGLVSLGWSVFSQ